MKYLGKHKIFDDLMIGGVLLTPPDPATYAYELTLPNDDGSAGQVLTTDGNGLLTWTTAAGSGITMTNGVNDRIMTATGAAAITGEEFLTWDGSTFLIESAADTFPAVKIKSTTNSTKGSILEFISDKGGAGLDNDMIGAITFTGDTDLQAQRTFGSISCRVNTALTADMAGEISMYVLNSDGAGTASSRNVITGTGRNDQTIDVDLAYGASSKVTTNGNLTVTGGNILLDGTGRITGVDTVSASTDAASKGYVDGLKTTLNGVTVNGIATYASANTLDIESKLTWDGTTDLTLGGNIAAAYSILTPNNAVGQGADRLTFNCGNSGAGTNMGAGLMGFVSGLGTGSQAGGRYNFYGAPAANPAGGAGVSTMVELFDVLVHNTGAGSTSKTIVYDINNARNHFVTEVKADGQTNLTTTDFASHNADLSIVADGAVDILSTDASNDITLNSAGEIELNADGGNVDFKNGLAHFAKLENLSNGRARLELYGGTCGSGNCGSEINLYEDTAAGTNHITLKGAWTSGGLSSDKTISLPNKDGYTALTDDISGGQYFHIRASMATKNITSTLNYYTVWHPFQNGLSNADATPGSIDYSDSQAALYIAPREGRISNIKIQGLSASGTGVQDPFKLYIYKAPLSTNASSITCTLMGETSSITPTVAGRTWKHTEDWASGMDFAEDDVIYVWYKKNSNSGAQTISFNINLNGYLTV